MCKKCIPEFLKQKQTQGRGGKGQQKSLSDNQMKDLAKMLGINTMALNAYQSEKNMITRSLQKIDDFKKDIKYYEQELQEREG